MGATGHGPLRDDGDVVRLLDRFEDVTSFLDALVRWAADRTPGDRTEVLEL